MSKQPSESALRAARLALCAIPVKQEGMGDYAAIVRGLAEAMEEYALARLYQECPELRPWQTLVRVEEVGEHHLLVCIPGWNPHESVRVFPWQRVIPESLWPYIKEGVRFYAMVNIGAETAAELGFSDWEYRGPFGEGEAGQ